MALRISAGTLKGLQLQLPPGTITRPTSGKVREAFMDSVFKILPDCIFCDLFAGSGAIGIEALSRGAAFSYFVENSRPALQILRKNLEKTTLRNSSMKLALLNSDVEKLRPLKPAPNLIWADPPYDFELAAIEKILLNFEQWTAPGTMFVLEISNKKVSGYSDHYGNWHKKRIKEYGDTSLIYFEKSKIAVE